MSLPTTEQLAHLAALLRVSDSQIARAKNDLAVRYAMDLWDAAQKYLDAAALARPDPIPPQTYGIPHIKDN